MESTGRKVYSELNLLYKTVEIFLEDDGPKRDLRNDLMALLIVVFFIENKFIPMANESEPQDLKDLTPRTLSKLILCNEVYTLNFCLNKFESMPVKIVLSPFGDTMLINVIIEDSLLDTFAAVLPISRYVVSTNFQNVHKIFKDLELLSKEINNKVVLPITSKILFYHGLPSPSLYGLPVEIFRSILLFLPIEDILSVKETCCRFRVLIEKEMIWHSLYKRDFNGLDINKDLNWKENYKRTYKIVKTTQKYQ